MSDYLSNLAARSLNLTEAIQPRSRSLFEPPHLASIPTSRQDLGLEEVDQVFTESETELDATAPIDFASTKSLETSEPFNNPKSKILNPKSLHQRNDEAELVSEAPLKEVRNLPISPPLLQQPPIANPIESIETRLDPPRTQSPLPSAPLVLPEPSIEREQQQLNQPMLTPTVAISETQAAPSSNTTEPQSAPRTEPSIHRIVERVATLNEPQAPTRFSPNPSPIQTTILPPTAPERLSRSVPQQPDSERSVLSPVVPSETTETEPSNYILQSKSQPPLLEPIVQQIVTERVVSPVQPSVKVKAHSEPISVPSTSATVVVQPQIKPHVERKALAPVQEQTTPEPIPTIQVTIGRIEIRATPPPIAPSQQQRPTPSVMSLDQYLNQRAKGGGR